MNENLRKSLVIRLLRSATAAIDTAMELSPKPSAFVDQIDAARACIDEAFGMSQERDPDPK